MKVILPVKEEFEDSTDADDSCDISSNSNSNSVPRPTTGVVFGLGSGVSRKPLTLSFGNLDGVHTGVPTLTTPTLTPSTLRNIAERLFEFEETERPEPHHNEAGFVPPLVEPIALGKNSFLNLVDSKAWIGGSTTITPTPPTMMGTPLMVSMANHYMPPASPPQQPTRRNVGGRRPAKKNGISPEEEERLQVRRERNKMAAARCRKRRSDHTNELTLETEELEKKRKHLQDEINKISQEKEQLEFLLEAHRAHCRLNGSMPRGSSPPDLKPLLYQNESRVIAQQLPRADSTSLVSQPLPPRKPHIGATASGMKRSRPSSLPVGAMEIAGVPITTPSTVIPFNFESLMEGGTGLTPVSSTGLSPMIPSCSSQQRNGIDLASPDNSFPPKLVSL